MKTLDELIQEFLKNNSEERVLDYFNKLRENRKYLLKKGNMNCLYLVLLVLIYFVFLNSPMASINIGTINISDKMLIYKLFPLIFAYLSFQTILITNKG